MGVNGVTRTNGPGRRSAGAIATGRYVAANAVSGCYRERLSGLGGTLAEILANDFQGFAGRVIVDVNATDTAFKKIRRAGRSRLVWHWSAGESASAGYLMPNQRPSFALRPWRLVGILVARAILRLAAVMPIARFHENVRPGASFTPAVLHVETTSRDDPLH